MPTTRANAASEAAKHGEFSAKVPPSEPLTTKGHAVGTQVGNDTTQEYHLEAFPAGTAPKEDTFQPNTEGEVPGQALNEFATERTSASDTLGGATSADVHAGYGKPVQGDQQHEKRKKERSGLAGVGASSGVDSVRQKGADLPEGVEKGTRGKGTDNYPSATEKEPETADSL